MAKHHYLGIIEKDPDSAYGIWFPDMPGCFPATDELADLPQDAVAALRQHVEVLQSSGLPVSEPRPFDVVMQDADVREAIAQGATTILVPLLADAGRTVRVNISLDKGLVDQIDDAASARGLTRSAFLAQAAREKIAKAA
jgi:predicted RNase H-like HicB family nuclease